MITVASPNTLSWREGVFFLHSWSLWWECEQGAAPLSILLISSK